VNRDGTPEGRSPYGSNPEGVILKIVIVGHVDHGKSTLIGRLLFDTNSLPLGKIEEIRKVSKELGREVEFAFLMDQLQEEREEGLTIDTTQTFFKTDKRNYVIIDAPGHIEFIKNMITGASQAEAAILIVSVEKGVQEETRRHAYLLSLLGLNQVIVVMNKMDLAGYRKERFEEVKGEVLKFLPSIGIKPSYLIPVSAKYGENIAKASIKMSWYEGLTVLKALDSLKIKPEAVAKPLRFPIQDVYKRAKERILVGRVESGIMRKDQQVLLLPSNRETRIESIKVFDQDKGEAREGESIGITLSEPLSVERGEVLCQKEDAPKATDNFKANIFWMSKEALKIEEEIMLRCATQEVKCSVDKIEKRLNPSTLEIIEENARELRLNEVGVARFKTERPMVVENFNFVKELGRFVLERKHEVMAGGIVTEAI